MGFASFVLGLLLGAVGGCVVLVLGILRVVSRRTAGVRAAQTVLSDANANFLAEAASAYEGGGMVLDWTRATMQLAGKASTRTVCWVSVQGACLFVSDKRDLASDRAFSVDLSGAELRIAPPEMQLVMPHCLELSHPHRKLVEPSADYVFLSFASLRTLNSWVDTLTRWCVTRASDAAFALPMYDLGADNLIRCKGPLAVQFGEGTAEMRYCVLERYAMTHFDASDLTKARHASRIHLYGVSVHEVAQRRFKAVSPDRPLCTSGAGGAAACDYVYFTVPKHEGFAAWCDAFAAHNADVAESSQRHDDADDTNPVRVPALLRGAHPRESARWLNAVLERFARNWRISNSLTEMVRAKMTKRLQQKIEARNLQSTISELEVVGLHIPASLPAIVFAQLLSSADSGKLVCDLLLDWDTRADPCVLRVACDVAINWPTPRFKVFPLELTLAISRLYGKAHVECNAFPASRFSFSFIDEPDMVFVCKSGFDVLPSALSSRLEDFVVQKLKLSLLQKIVMPNRKFFNIPKSAEAVDPAEEHQVLEPYGSTRRLLLRTNTAQKARPASSVDLAGQAGERPSQHRPVSPHEK